MQKRNGDLEKLKKLTENLKPFKQLIKERNEFQIEYETIKGTMLGFGLYKNDDIAIQRIFMSKDSKIEEHFHLAKEIGIIYKGKLSVNIENKIEKICEKGDIIYFNINEPHSIEALEDTWSVWITIPAGEGYPNK